MDAAAMDSLNVTLMRPLVATMASPINGVLETTVGVVDAPASAVPELPPEEVEEEELLEEPPVQAQQAARSRIPRWGMFFMVVSKVTSVSDVLTLGFNRMNEY
jgi:hypothetical protein